MSNELDYSISSIEGRLEKVQEIVNKYDDDFVMYYTDYFQPFLTTTGKTSEHENMTQELERMADYLLYMDSKKARDEIEPTFTITTKRQEEETKKKEFTTDTFLTTDVQQQRSASNRKKFEKIKVTKQDRDAYPELQETGEAIERMVANIKSKIDSCGNPLSEEQIRKLKWIVIDLRKDEVAIKECLKGYITFKRLSTSSFSPNFQHMSFANEKHIKILLDSYSLLKESSYEDTIGDLKIILLDFERLIDQCSFEPYLYDILMMKIDGYSRRRICEEIFALHNIDISESRISQITGQLIPLLIAEEYKRQFEEWLFTFIKKGTYKWCNRCKRNKLASSKYFSKDMSKKDGFKYTCKTCEKRVSFSSKGENN